MGDTSVYLTVHACPPHQARTVLDLIDNHQLDDGAPAPASVSDGALALGHTFVSYRASLGDVEEIHSTLRRYAPLATWTVHDTPTSEGLGTLIVYTPAGGEWRAECGEDGYPMFDRKEVRRAVDEGEAEVALLLGDDWFTATEGMPEAVVVEPRRHEATWDRKTGCITVEGAAEGGEDLELAQRVKRQLTGDMVADRALAEEALHAAGFVLAEAWSSYDRRRRLHEAEAYRVAEFAPEGWRWCAECGGLVLDEVGLAVEPADSALCVVCRAPECPPDIYNGPPCGIVSA